MNKTRFSRTVALALLYPMFLGCLCRGPDEFQVKEAQLKDTLHLMREAIDQYTQDHDKAPQELKDLVKAHYFREIPKDPITGSADTWQVVPEDALRDRNQPGIMDVHSGSRQISSKGTSYDSW
jgi:general secretion pathway protein G